MSTSPTSPIASFPPISPSDHSRAPEFYGFVAWTTTSLLFCIFVLWALLPDEWIIWLGVEWYPSREWALLLPAYSMFLILLTYFVYFALAIANTPPFSHMSTMIDSTDRLRFLPPFGFPNPLAHTENDDIPKLYDIPIGLVNRVVYGKYEKFRNGYDLERSRSNIPR